MDTGGRWLAEFGSGGDALRAAKRLREQGYQGLEIHSPYEVPGAAEALGHDRPRAIPRSVLLGGLSGGAIAYWIQWYADAVSFPIDVGGRPLHAAPAFVPITFEGAVLVGAFAALGSLLALARLPRLWRPVFEVEGFERVSADRYWLALHARDATGPVPEERIRDDLEALEPIGFAPVEARS